MWGCFTGGSIHYYDSCLTLPRRVLGRHCPSCGRRVPRSVATCRCGAELPADVDSVVDDDDASDARKPGGPTFVAIALLVGTAGTGHSDA